MDEISRWIHVDAIQALIHHASAVVTAIFIFAITARLIAYLIPNGHAKKMVMIIDDVVLLAVFALAGWRLLNYMWVRPHVEDRPQQEYQLAASADGAADGAEDLLARCRKGSPAKNDVLRCLTDQKAQADQEMADAAARMAADMKALDKVGSAKIGAKRSFDAAQSTFLLYREAECRWLSMSARNGASEGVYQACMAELARRRAARIQEILRR